MKISFVLLCFLIEEKRPCIDVRGCDRYNHNKNLEQQMRGIIKLHWVTTAKTTIELK